MHDPYLQQLKDLADPDRAAGMAGYHKIDRPYLGLSNPQINDLTKGWRQQLDVDSRVAVARGLWQTDIYEARLAAAKLLTQARIRPPSFVLFGTRVDQLPMSYQRYLLNGIRNELGFGAVPVRLTMRSPKNPYQDGADER